jgi:MFS family permease
MSEQSEPRIIDGLDADMNPVAAGLAPVPVVVPAPPAAPVKRRWLSNLILTFTMFADLNEAGIVGTLFALIRVDLGLGLSALGILTALAKLISAIFGPLWALLARRFNRKLVLVVATVVGGLWTVAIGFSQNFPQFLILFVIATLCTVAALPIITELVGDLFPDKLRGSATGMMWGVIALIGAIAIPLFGQLANIPHGWRVGFYIIGAIVGVSGLLTLVAVYDPGRGATESVSTKAAGQEAHVPALKWSEVRQLFRIPSYVLMLVSRLLSGHLLLQSFGVIYLVTVFHYTLPQAALIFGPAQIGYVIGSFAGGIFVDLANKTSPRYGRILMLQLAQFCFAAVAFFGTQFNWGTAGIFIAFFFAMSFLQGVNPGINRPIVYAIVPPALRGAAFAVMLSIVESIGWAIYNLLAGFLGQTFGLQPVFLAVLVVVMLVNVAVIFVLYRTYWPDVQKLQRGLQEQDQQAA